MASYLELYELSNTDSALRQKLVAACQDLANTILGEASPSSTRLAWAKSTRDHPRSAVDEILWPVLIENKSATVAQIQNAGDAAILANVVTQIGKRYGTT